MNNTETLLFYACESAEATSLTLIPLSIRYRLDCCAIKLHLRQWQQFTLAERECLLRLPFTSADDIRAWAAQLTAVAQQRCNCLPDQLTDTGEAAWLQLAQWPADVVERCRQLDLPLPALRFWQQLAPPHRHALFKIAHSHHDFLQLPAALREILSVDNLHRKD